jgi:hypothetical protein
MICPKKRYLRELLTFSEESSLGVILKSKHASFQTRELPETSLSKCPLFSKGGWGIWLELLAFELGPEFWECQ